MSITSPYNLSNLLNERQGVQCLSFSKIGSKDRGIESHEIHQSNSETKREPS